MQAGELGAASAVPSPRFRTDELALAASLHAAGYLLVSVEARRGNASFIFTWEADLEGFVEDYHDGQAEVEPRSLLQAAAHCRNKMFDALDDAAGRPRRHHRNGR